jgi:hypothetical protein
MHEYNLFKELMKDKPKPSDDIVTRQRNKHLTIIKATGFEMMD